MACQNPNGDNSPSSVKLNIQPIGPLPTKDRAPWKRYLARFLDNLIVGFPCFVVAVALWGVVSLTEGEQTYQSPVTSFLIQAVTSVIFLGLIVVYESVLLSTWGTTLGKRVFGLKVCQSQGQKLSFGQAFKRSTWINLMLVLTSIMPLITACINYWQYRCLMKDGYALWDKGEQLLVCPIRSNN